MTLIHNASSEPTTVSPNTSTEVIAAVDETSAIAAIVTAFSADPVVRWVWSEPSVYLTHFPSFVQVFGGEAFAQRTAFSIKDYAATALWLPPGVHPDEEMLNHRLPDLIPEQRQQDFFAIFEEMERYHPIAPHWYLAIIGVDPLQQGKGYGSALLQSVLTLCDRDHKLAYLEASSLRSKALYERHGFESLGTLQAGTSPQFFPMLRKPR